jgi:hypothetical protein
MQAKLHVVSDLIQELLAFCTSTGLCACPLRKSFFRNPNRGERTLNKIPDTNDALLCDGRSVHTRLARGPPWSLLVVNDPPAISADPFVGLLVESDA